MPTTEAPDPAAGPAVDSEQQRVRAWPVLLLAAPAGVAIWSGWVGLGELTGFGNVQPLPGIWDGLELNTAITLPIGMEAYAAYALRAWLTSGTPVRARRFAKRSAIGALVLGALGQIAYHLMVAADVTAAPWPITTVVSCLPVAVLGMGAALAHLLRDPTARASAPVDRKDQEYRPAAVPGATRPGRADQPGTARPAQPEAPAHTDPADAPGGAERTLNADRTATRGAAGPGDARAEQTELTDTPHSPTAGSARPHRPGPRPGRAGPPAASGPRDRPTTAATSAEPPAGSGRPGTASRVSRLPALPAELHLTARDQELLPQARELYSAHLASTGKPLSRNALRRELGIGAKSASRLIAAVRYVVHQASDKAA